MIPYGLQQVPGNPHTSDTSCLKDGPNRPMGSAHETSASCTRVSEQPWGEVRLKGLFTQSCPTLCDSVDWSPTGSSVHGILQALERVAIPFSRGSSRLRD